MPESLFKQERPPVSEYRPKPKPKKSNKWLGLGLKIAAWVFIIGVLIFIGTIIALEPKSKTLVCDKTPLRNGLNSLLVFGRCKEM